MAQFVMVPYQSPESLFIPVNSLRLAQQVVEAFGAIRRLPHYRGDGYIAGEAPDGLVLLNGAPAERTVDLFHRATGILVASTSSDPADGTYQFDGLDQAVLFDVRFRGDDDTEADILASWITPEPP